MDKKNNKKKVYFSFKFKLIQTLNYCVFMLFSGAFLLVVVVQPKTFGLTSSITDILLKSQFRKHQKTI